ncbi:MAG: L,D-transpeptidase family protein [Sulfurovum sp.]|nr:MAG: L,D-transpeptidase family protein [Sulfurovum sp.]
MNRVYFILCFFISFSFADTNSSITLLDKNSTKDTNKTQELQKSVDISVPKIPKILPTENVDNLIADKIIIKKSTRMLYLSNNGKIFKKYYIVLGDNPVGHKNFSGDEKTPEGVYFLDWRQKSQSYNLSLHVSYPNEKDKANAAQYGLSAGGMIMIHGTPKHWELSPVGSWLPLIVDWTDGCIGVNNKDMIEIWNQTRDGIPIIILA